MADISLGTADVARILCLFGTEESAQSIRLKLILFGKTAAMGFKVTDRPRRCASLKTGPFNRESIGITVRALRFNLPAGRRADTLDDGIDMITVLFSIIEAFEYDRSSALSNHRTIGILIKGSGDTLFGEGLCRLPAEHRTQIASHIGSTDNGPIDGAFLKGAHPDFESPQPGIFFTGQGEAWATDFELLGDPACHDTTERTHDPIGTQGWPGRFTQGCNPCLEFLIGKIATKLLCPLSG